MNVVAERISEVIQPTEDGRLQVLAEQQLFNGKNTDDARGAAAAEKGYNLAYLKSKGKWALGRAKELADKKISGGTLDGDEENEYKNLSLLLGTSFRPDVALMSYRPETVGASMEISRQGEKVIRASIAAFNNNGDEFKAALRSDHVPVSDEDVLQFVQISCDPGGMELINKIPGVVGNPQKRKQYEFVTGLLTGKLTEGK